MNYLIKFSEAQMRRIEPFSAILARGFPAPMISGSFGNCIPDFTTA